MSSSERTDRPSLVVLGAGAAGLAVAFYARRAGLPFTLIEAAPHVGGLAATFREGEFLFDLGAHRFHDKDPEVTADVRALLGDDLLRVSGRSHIFLDGRLLDFPPSPLNLLARLGPLTLARSALEMLRVRQNGGPPRSFEDAAVRSYGRSLADLLLLRYTTKLWGTPCSRLAPDVGGGRLKGLNLSSLVVDMLFGEKRRAAHLDGSFFYPALGIGELAEALADASGRDRIRTQARVTRISHRDGRIESIEIDGRATLGAATVVSTLPLDLLARLLDPPLPAHLLEEAGSLRFRHLLLVAFFVDRPSVTRSATIYFPSPEVPFTRLYEPRNRSPRMSPAGRTSLVAEIPCGRDDALWTAPDPDVVALVQRHLEGLGFVGPREVLGARVVRLPRAYPIIEIDTEDRLAEVRAYLTRFRNLHLSGRNGRFAYTWIHVLMRWGREIVDQIAADRPGVATEADAILRP